MASLNRSIALWATNLDMDIESVADWVALVDARVAQAASESASLLLMPEYVSESWLAFKPDGLKPTQEMAFLADHAPDAIDALAASARSHGITIVAGSMPWHGEAGQIVNRAWTLMPDGTRLCHDKLALTPAEMDEEAWEITPGRCLRIFEWKGLRCAVVVCLDVEMPALSVALARHGIDLLLVPSMTYLPTGYSRVFGCAKARAIELMCAVAVTGCVGASRGTTQNEHNYSACAVYLPCETEIGSFGVHVETEMTDGANGDDPFVIARDIPFDTIRELRSGKAEVWPGAWSAGHVEIIDETKAKAAAE
ncbi:nitrilase-related carbon-nitrogen hydrolase [Tepidamorphus sp. 3E244]|uniref:nitrilase-related carbon-nitrogen hydrolase n=1 Tax=Tepidamorphus sp. 3E244 TaxID=3385498 RepID=UPI0038FC509F